MASKSESVPREHELLCEHCGYGLDGLPADALCPECGHPVADSTTADGRQDPPWENPSLPAIRRLLTTTTQVVFSPAHFFRHMRTRTSATTSVSFAFIHHWIAGYFFGLSIAVHYLTVVLNTGNWDATTTVFITLVSGAVLTPVVFGGIAFVRWLAGRLSVLEARYHGMRLPHVAVARALHYHAAHLTPVALVTLLITAGFRLGLYTDLLERGKTEIPYLYILSGWVILAAGYLFVTYWTAMKSIMYANR